MRLAPKIVLTVLFAAGVALGVLAIAPPTGLLDVWLNAATGGRVRLAQTEGTLWQGAARVVLVDPVRASRPDATLGPLPGLAMPGMLRWSLSPVSCSVCSRRVLPWSTVGLRFTSSAPS